MGAKYGPNALLVSKKQELDVRTALQRHRGARHDDGRTVIAPHRIKRYANVARHSLVRPRPKGRCSGVARRGRDNSALDAQGNAITRVDWARLRGKSRLDSRSVRRKRPGSAKERLRGRFEEGRG
jgi:hypothetical protein